MFGKRNHELSAALQSAIEKNTLAVLKLADKLEKFSSTLEDHEKRITVLESR